jgi:hypothetical protein
MARVSLAWVVDQSMQRDFPHLSILIGETIMASIRIHSQTSGAAAIKAVGEVVVSCKWKQTANQSSKERAILIPMECVKAPEVPESFRALVESVLMSAAEGVLKTHVNLQGDACNEIGSEEFDRPNLVQSFMSGSDSWMSKQELEVAFTASETWKRIVSQPEFKSNQVYQLQANRFKDVILKLSGKAVQLEADKCDLILAKIDDRDLETEFGAFVVGRLAKMKEKNVDAFDLSAL